jgi:hypothetical protein
MVDDGQFLKAALVIVPINFLWSKWNIPWAFKRRLEINIVVAALLTDAFTVHTLYDAFGVLAGLVFFTFWIFQIQWTRPKLAYEL